MKYIDFSNFNKNHFLYSDNNRKKLLHFKDEHPNDMITDFAGLRSKSYAFRTHGSSHHVKCKGYKKAFARSYLKYSTFMKCRNGLKTLKFPFTAIRGINQELFTIRQNKDVLSNFDGKLFVYNCNIHTSFYGSKEINISGECPFCKINRNEYPNRIM